ncbi:EamA family transporter [Stutzerimonas kirkiae]|uniref:EamA family transporter n=1 Tax=Stutzerimonas kirkiae TaxID=2211392 RepID=UPI0010384B65|nr:EamA family transporter [Stutzerimonas kirkiae]TBV09841.1 multidrug transporter [Stutzerimonas kirkiae]
MLWIPFTLLAAFTQALRNAQQKILSRDVNAIGVTLARFIWALPLAGVYLLILELAVPTEVPHFSGRFLFSVSAAAFAQILATILMVLLFQRRSYAAGVGLAKSEALLAAILGAAFFGALLGPIGWLGIATGSVAVWLMKGRSEPGTLDLPTLLLGLGSGLCFALTTLWVRDACHQLSLPFMHTAAWALVWTIGIQVSALTAWLALRDRATLLQLWHQPSLVFRISLSSSIASLCWFTAVNLEQVALVKTLGQVEVLFTLLLSQHWLKEQVSPRERLGLLLIVVSAILVILPALTT